MSLRIAQKSKWLWTMPLSAVLAGALIMTGCNQSEVVSPVSEQEVDELELDFDDGLEAPGEAPSVSTDLPGDNP
jgi:hypothetical protein